MKIHLKVQPIHQGYMVWDNRSKWPVYLKGPKHTPKAIFLYCVWLMQLTIQTFKLLIEKNLWFRRQRELDISQRLTVADKKFYTLWTIPIQFLCNSSFSVIFWQNSANIDRKEHKKCPWWTLNPQLSDCHSNALLTVLGRYVLGSRLWKWALFHAPFYILDFVHL